MESKLEKDDIVVALDNNGNIIIESIGEIKKVYEAHPMSSNQNPIYRVEFFSTSALYRNEWENYDAKQIKKLTAHEVFYLLRVREKMKSFKSMKDGVL
jgi:hypothetical protein